MPALDAGIQKRQLKCCLDGGSSPRMTGVFGCYNKIQKLGTPEPAMEWEDFRRSDNVEDRRNEQYAGDGSGGMGGTGIGTGHLGLGAIVVLA